MKTIIDIKSLIIGILVTVLFFTVIGAKNRNNVNFDTITANKINIVDAKGKHVATLGINQVTEGGQLSIFNQQGKLAAILTSAKGQGALVITNQEGEPVATLASVEGEGKLAIYKPGRKTCSCFSKL